MTSPLPPSEYDVRVKPISEDQAVALIASMRADGDRFRERARAVATLLATAAGALTAGLVFSSVGEALRWQLKIAGAVGILALTISVCFFLSASLYSVKEDEPAIPSPATSSANRSVHDYLDSAKTVSRSLTTEISKRTQRGKWWGLAGLIALALMLPLGVFLPEERLHVGLQVTSPDPRALQQCPLFKGYVEGEIAKDDLSGTSTLVPVTISGNQCDASREPGTKTLYFVRSQVVLAVLGTQ